MRTNDWTCRLNQEEVEQKKIGLITCTATTSYRFYLEAVLAAPSVAHKIYSSCGEKFSLSHFFMTSWPLEHTWKTPVFKIPQSHPLRIGRSKFAYSTREYDVILVFKKKKKNRFDIQKGEKGKFQCWIKVDSLWLLLFIVAVVFFRLFETTVYFHRPFKFISKKFISGVVRLHSPTCFWPVRYDNLYAQSKQRYTCNGKPNTKVDRRTDKEAHFSVLSSINATPFLIFASFLFALI